jgi:hypothetical protein
MTLLLTVLISFVVGGAVVYLITNKPEVKAEAEKVEAEVKKDGVG